MRTCALFAAAALAAAWSLPAQGATVTIADTDTAINAYFGNFDTSVLFVPPSDGGPVKVTGSVDISGMNTGDNGDNSVLMVGLISKVAFDAEPGAPGDNFFGLFDSVFASFSYRGNSGFFGALGQRTTSGAESAMVIFGHGSNPPVPDEMADGILDDGEFEIVFGTDHVEFTIAGATISMVYDSYVDFSQGAYAFAGSFLNREGGSATYDLVWNGPSLQTPEPGPLALFAVALAGFGALRYRRRRAA